MTLNAHELIAHIDLDTTEFDRAHARALRALHASPDNDVQRALETDHRVDQRSDGGLLGKLAVACGRVAHFRQQRAGDRRILRQFVDLGGRVFDRIIHGLAPSSLAGSEGSVGRSSASQPSRGVDGHPSGDSR